jgi:hypothetical protein
MLKVKTQKQGIWIILSLYRPNPGAKRRDILILVRGKRKPEEEKLTLSYWIESTRNPGSEKTGTE